MMALKLKSAKECEFDLVSLGECMVRLSPPGHGRIEFASTMEVWVGGGEYNVAYALARLGMRTAWVGRLPDNPLGRLVLNHARAAGVDVGCVVVVPPDGVGRKDRVGLNFTEVGTGLRASV
ncbi:MAG: PfkB family carbohydrate kinase, partial [bacterium]